MTAQTKSLPTVCLLRRAATLCLQSSACFFSARFLLASLTQLDAVIVYPTYSVATILAVTLAGVAVFRERLHRRQWYALAAILAALVMLNS